MSNVFDFSRRLAVIFSIVALIALVHIFRIGSYLQGELYNFYYSYFSDYILPLGCYFLLCAEESWICVLATIIAASRPSCWPSAKPNCETLQTSDDDIGRSTGPDQPKCLS